jgi:hypothetical protein
MNPCKALAGYRLGARVVASVRSGLAAGAAGRSGLAAGAAGRSTGAAASVHVTSRAASAGIRAAIRLDDIVIVIIIAASDSRRNEHERCSESDENRHYFTSKRHFQFLLLRSGLLGGESLLRATQFVYHRPRIDARIGYGQINLPVSIDFWPGRRFLRIRDPKRRPILGPRKAKPWLNTQKKSLSKTKNDFRRRLEDLGNSLGYRLCIEIDTRWVGAPDGYHTAASGDDSPGM